MRAKIFIVAVLAIAASLDSNGQKRRIVRKGSKPVQITRTVPVAQYSLKQLDGRWQEIKRIPLNSKISTDFTDSLLMYFYNGKVELRDNISMRMSVRGAAEIEAPNTLSAAGDIYTIKSLDKNKLVIDDGEFLREMRKADQFYYETLGKIKIERDSFSKPVNINAQTLKGKWMVYARQAEPGVTKEQTALIKSLDIKSVSEDGTATGEIVFYTTGNTETFPCKLFIKDGSLQINGGRYIWNFYTYKADGDEFVFGETGKLLYYSKR